MKLQCFFGKHTYGFYGQDQDPDQNVQSSGKNVQIQTCERKCTECQKTLRFRRELSIDNAFTDAKWKRLR